MKRIRITMVMFVAAMLPVAACGRERAEPRDTPVRETTSDAEYLVSVNKETLERYLLQHDTRLYRDNALPEYLFLANIGIVESREEVVTTAGNLRVSRASVENEHTLINDNTAVLIGLLDLEGSVMGTRLPNQMRYMTVFVRKPEGWRMLSQALTNVIDPKTLPRGD
jgi:hypothetical protein